MRRHWGGGNSVGICPLGGTAMPPVNIASSALVTISGHQNQQIVDSVFCYKVLNTPITAAKVDHLLSWWLTTGYPAYRLMMPQAYSPDSITVKSVDPGLSYEAVGSGTGLSTGSRAGDPINGETAPIIWKSGTPTRSGKGRTSFGPLVEPDVTQDILTSGLLSVMTAVSSFLIGTFP